MGFFAPHYWVDEFIPVATGESMGCLDLIAHVRLPKKSISETVELEFPSLAKLEAGDDFLLDPFG